MSIYLRDPRLQGVSYAVAPNATQVGLVCPTARRVCVVAPGLNSIVYQGDVVVPLTPGAIVADSSFFYVLARDTIYKITLSASPALSATLSLGLDTLKTTGWAFLFEGRLLVPCGSTGAQVLTTAGAVVSTRPDQLSNVTRAAFDPVGRRLYLCDGNTGLGVVLAISTAGLLTYTGSFRAPNVKPVTGMLVDGTTLVVTSDHRLLKFSLASPDAPALTSSTTYTQTINGVVTLSAGHYWLATNENNPVQSYPFTYGDTGAIIGPAGIFVWNRDLSRVSSAISATSIDGTVVMFSSLGNINGLQFNGLVRTMALSGNTLVCGGDFSSITDAAGAHARSFLCAIDITTGLVTSFNPAPSALIDIARFDPSGRLWIGGNFGLIGAAARGRLALFNADLTLNAFDGQADSEVFGIAFGNGLAYIGGNFGSLGGASRAKGGAFNLTTLLIDPINLGASGGAGNGRRCLVSAGNDAYFSGDMTSPKAGVAAFTSAGVLKVFNPQLAGLSATGDGMAELASLIYIGGDFSSAGGQSRNRLAAFDYSGTLQPFSVNLNLSCYTIAVDPAKAVVYAGGNFTQANSTNRRFAAAFGTDGSLNAWDPGLTGGSIVYEFLFVAPFVFMVGSFTNPAGGTCIYVTQAA